MTSHAHLAKVGFFLFVVISLIVGSAVWFTWHKIESTKGMQISVRFRNVKGLQAGADVRANGVGIGAVQSVIFDPSRGGAIVVLGLRKDKTISKRSWYSISTGSLLGEASVDIYSCSGNYDPSIPPPSELEACHPSIPSEPLDPNSEAPGIFEATANLDDAVQELEGVIRELRTTTLDGVNEILDELLTLLQGLGPKMTSTVTEVEMLATDLRSTTLSIQGSVESFFGGLDLVVKDLQALSGQLPQQVEGVLSEVENTLLSASNLLDNLREDTDGIRLEERLDSIESELHSILSDIRSVTESLSSAGLVESITGAVESVESTASSLSQTAAKIARVKEEGEVRVVWREGDATGDGVESLFRFGLSTETWFFDAGLEVLGNTQHAALLGGWKGGPFRIGAGLRRDSPATLLRWEDGMWLEGLAWWDDALSDPGYQLGIGIPLGGGPSLYLGWEESPGSEGMVRAGFSHTF